MLHIVTPFYLSPISILKLIQRMFRRHQILVHHAYICGRHQPQKSSFCSFRL